MQTALHILSLVSELNHEAIGGKVVNTEFYKKERAAYFFIKTDSSLLALGFIYHPAGSGFFVVPASKLKIDTREKPWPIFDLHGGEVTEIRQLGLDRIFYLDIMKKQKTRCVFEAIGSNGNIWLLDEHLGRQAVLRNRDYAAGEKYNPSPMTGRLDPLELDAGSMREQLALHKHSLSLVTFLEKNIIGFSRTLAKEAVKRAGLESAEVSTLDDAAVAALANVTAEIASRFTAPSGGYLYTIAGAAEVYPFKLSIVDDQPEKFKTLSLAVMAMTTRRQTRVEEADQRKITLDSVDKSIEKLSRRIAKLEQDIKEAADFEMYKRQAELLQINFNSLKRGMKSIRVSDVYSSSHDTVEIPLYSALTPKDNVEAYFKKHRKGREGLELLERRLLVTRTELSELEKICVELERNFDESFEKYRNELASLLPREVRAEIAQPRMPYREYKLSTGVTIFVGRDGSDNDRTTFEFAKPFELWFHTQQCAGSHVVLKFPNKSFEPSKREIEETASIAAFFSKAKNDSLVPVAYTERRYVRKPRNAKPGLVIIEREKSVMVVPRKPL